MMLNSSERQRLAQLAYAGRTGTLTSGQEAEMRRLLARERGEVGDLSVGELIGLALVVIGAAALIGMLASR